MTARVLVVDDVRSNLKLLQARLSLEYFEVITATNGPDAIAICEKGGCDIVLLDVKMPGMDGFEVCRRLRTTPATAHLPIVLLTASDRPADRVRGLESGADDFLTKPVDEIALIARARSLTRLKFSIDELRARAAHSAEAGVAASAQALTPDGTERGRLLLVDEQQRSRERVAGALSPYHDVILASDPGEALAMTREQAVDLMIVSLCFAEFDGLRLCTRTRSHESTRNLPILLIADPDDRPKVLRGLELGVNDYLTRPIDRNELLARVRTNIRQKRYADRLRQSVQESIEMAHYDPLTGLNNRRSLERRLPTMIETARLRGAALTMMVLDIDHFKRVNDTYGHDVGDLVLKGFGAQLQETVRSADLVCRLGGEEFVIVMPGVGLSEAARIAERARRTTEGRGFVIDGAAGSVAITVSIGLAEWRKPWDSAELYRHADRALYLSKSAGRNRVTQDAA
ncbi:MAG: PleD family two-component system response regulator [Hyphomicrobiales bacterium]|nr:PleD family two-component system response regulator [Hyphomicrobiales bacterium]